MEICRKFLALRLDIRLTLRVDIRCDLFIRRRIVRLMANRRERFPAATEC